MIWTSITILVISILHSSTVYGCQFYPPGEYLRFVRVPENLKVGQEVLQIQVHPRRNLRLQPIDKDEDVHYFTYRDVNRTTISLLLARSLEEIVDTNNPRNVLKFKVSCDQDDGEDIISSSLSITVYVEDLNDHSPVFVDAPYHVAVDELTPVGLTIFRGIEAVDHDKPNTPNSDVQYAITAGNDRGKFALDSSQQAFLLLKKPLDYDTGDREFTLTITASDRGLPPRSTNTTVKISVLDNDDLSPKFTKGVYRTKVTESYPLTGEKIHHFLRFDPPIYAFDQDLALDTPVRYDIIAGNERKLFYLDHANGSLYLKKEIDLDSERSLPGNTFVLQIQASQIDNPLKTGVARVEVEVLDLNDNLPEFEVDFYNISIVENLPNGFSVLQIVATDQDQGDNAEFSYQLVDNSGAFALDPKTGWLTVKDQTVLDREQRSTINMKVYAKEKTPSVVTDKEDASSVKIEVTLLDANDNNPTFIPNNIYNFIISTDVKLGDVIGQIHAIDPDQGRNGLVGYSLQNAANSSTMFSVNSRTGQIFVNKVPVSLGKHLLFVEASDQPVNPSERRFSLAVATIEVKPIGEKGAVKGLPEFIGAPYEFWVGGNAEVGTSVGQIRVSDNPYREKLTFDLLHSYATGVPFAVEELSGTVTVVDDLTKYDRPVYEFEAVVTNDRNVSLTTNVTIHVVDPQDQNNVIMKSATMPIEFHISENRPNALIGQLVFKNISTNNLKFSIANQRDVTDHIAITPNGSLYTETALDRETRDVYRLTVIVEYTKGLMSGTGIYQVTVYVDDENDNAPKFDRKSYEGRIVENCVSGTEVNLNYPVHVSDADVGSNGQISVAIFGDGSEMFRLDRYTGKVYFASGEKALDRERRSVFNLRLIAKDKGNLQDEANLTIYVDDENDNAPTFVQVHIVPSENGITVLQYDESGNKNGVFEKTKNASVYELSKTHIKSRGKIVKKTPLISLPEDVPVGNTLLIVVAEDKDAGENAVPKYEMVSETYIPNERSLEPFHVTHYFMVHPILGEVSVAKTLPPESEFRLNVSVTDKGGLRDYILIRILVKDVNDHPPIFKKSWYNFNTEESSYVRKVLGKVEALDGDFGQNANISYAIVHNESTIMPFTISKFTGVLTVDGELDRETRDKYNFMVQAKDNPRDEQSLTSTVSVEVNVLDINDNPPTFYGYDDIIQVENNKIDADYNRNQHKYTSYSASLPVYYATVAENAPVGTPITKVFANDSDFAGNGNGLILFDIPHKKSTQNLFTVDSKDGVVTTIGRLDYESQSTHNVTIVASDLGLPTLSSTALLIVNVIDVPEDLLNSERPVFAHRYYEIEVEENVPVPLKLLTLNVTEPYRSHKLKYSIVDDKVGSMKKIFKIDSTNGTLFIIRSPDREKRALYELRIRLDQYRIGRDMTVVVYPVTNERLGDLGLNEVKVIVRVTDVNDNAPRFAIMGRPFVAAVPTSANFGYQVIRLHATDPDLGLNGEVRYQILGKPDDEIRRFAIDHQTGQIRAIANFAKEAGKVYGFDVKATDRRGADDGKSSIANVVVYVLDEQKQLVMVVGSKPVEVEKNMDNISRILYNITGYDIRVRKLEPHPERNQIDNSATDMYVYAVDPILNSVVGMNQLQKVLHSKRNEIERKLEGYKILAITNGGSDHGRSRSQRVLLSTLEVGVVVLGCVVFVGALATAICVICIRRKKRRMLQKSYMHSHQPLGYAIAANTLGKAALFPASYADSFSDAHEMSQSPQGFPLHHDPGCAARFTAPYSGHDSGIADGATHCHCAHTSSQSSEDSSNYEDSLKSVAHRKGRASTLRPDHFGSRSFHQRRVRNRSLTEEMIHTPGGMRRFSHMPPAPALLLSTPAGLRRSTEHLVMTLNS